MNCKIPFTKDIEFEHKLQEITSISLEHDYKVEDGELKGNFIVAGDFKSHEVSINKEPFSYILPFEIELNNNIDTDTLEFMIEDFTYEVIENKILRVNIDFRVIASEKEVKEEEKKIEFQDIDTAFLDTKEDRETTEETLETPEETKEENKEEDNRNFQNVEDTIINNVKDGDSYATYHIHMVNKGESVETICSMYNTNMAFLSEYNDLNNLNEGDKLIIPETDE